MGKEFKSNLSERALNVLRGGGTWAPGKTFYVGDVAYKVVQDTSTGTTWVVDSNGNKMSFQEFRKYTSEF